MLQTSEGRNIWKYEKIIFVITLHEVFQIGRLQETHYFMKQQFVLPAPNHRKNIMHIFCASLKTIFNFIISSPRNTRCYLFRSTIHSAFSTAITNIIIILQLQNNMFLINLHLCASQKFINVWQ